MWSIYNDDLQVMKYLLENVCTFIEHKNEVKYSSHIQILHLQIRSKNKFLMIIHNTLKLGQTALMWACGDGRLNSVQLLLKKGAAMNAIDNVNEI